MSFGRVFIVYILFLIGAPLSQLHLYSVTLPGHPRKLRALGHSDPFLDSSSPTRRLSTRGLRRRRNLVDCKCGSLDAVRPQLGLFT